MGYDMQGFYGFMDEKIQEIKLLAGHKTITDTVFETIEDMKLDSVLEVTLQVTDDEMDLIAETFNISQDIITFNYNNLIFRIYLQN